MQQAVAQQGVLPPLGMMDIHHRTSIYADDVMTFVAADKDGLRACVRIMKDFGKASGLCINLAKCSAHLIRCSPEQVEAVQEELRCPILSFPCTYLGLPLGLRKPSASQLQPLVDWVANKLPS